MKLAAVGAAGARCAALLLAPFGPARSAQSGTIRFIVGRRRAARSILMRGSSPSTWPRRSARPSSSRTSPAPAATSRRSSSPSSRPTDNMIWVGTQAFTEINPNVFNNLRWSIDDFMPIIRGVEAPLVFVAHPSVPANNFAEFLAWAKANNGKLSYSSYTRRHAVAFPRLPAEREVRSRSDPRAVSRLRACRSTALIAGHSLFGFAQVNSTLPQVRAGKLKAFARHRADARPLDAGRADLRRARLSGIHRRVWFGLLVKDGTPPDIVDAADRSRQGRARRSDVRQKLEAQGYEVAAETGPQLMPNIKDADRALGQAREGVGLFGRGSRQHEISCDVRYDGRVSHPGRDGDRGHRRHADQQAAQHEAPYGQSPVRCGPGETMGLAVNEPPETVK